jgi:multiple sugar transport system ATP-binding protein
MGQVTLRGVRKSFGETHVIQGVDLEVRNGEFLVFVGPSGCGKTTTLRMIAGLESISSGDLLIDGVRSNDLHPAQRGAAMVFQSYALYPHMTVAENMGFSLRMAGVPRQTRDEQVRKAAETLRIESLLSRFPKELSGGQRQRVAIGRAIVRKPKVFLFDEPLSNLDAALRVDMRVELRRLHQELGTTMIYVTHDQVEAMTLGDRIAVFNKGRIEQLGPPLELYQRPANEFVATFLGAPKINLIDRPGEGAPAQCRALWQALCGPNDMANIHRAGLRPEHLAVSDAACGIPAHILFAEHLGDASLLHLKVEGVDTLLNAKVSSGHEHWTSGQMVWLKPDTGCALAFDRQGRLIS